MTIFSAFILGLVASAHCAGMWGGLQVALQGMVLRSQQQMLQHVILLNLGRLLTYVTAGVLLASFGFGIVNPLDIPNVSYWTRVFSGAVIVLIGVQLLFKEQRPFQLIEVLGTALWRKVSVLITAKESTNKHTKKHSLFTGMIWGFLPCGLVYGVLIVSMLADSLLDTGLVMLGFGLGTLPALMLTGVFYQQFKTLISQPTLQMAGGMFFILGGALMLSAPLWVSRNFLYDYPELLNVVFCVT